MLNIELIEELYAGQSDIRKQQLNRLLFGDSGQGISLFRESGGATFAQMEALADFFNMPLDMFRKKESRQVDTESCSPAEIQKVIGNVSANVEKLTTEVNNLMLIVREKRKELKVQNGIMETLRIKLEAMNDGTATT